MQRRYRESRNHWLQRTALAVAVAACFSGNLVFANPTGPAVAQGQSTFATQGNTLTVTNTPGTVINWQGFSIAGNEIARFIQQSQSSSVLNRVVGINPSAILGTLQSNGRVFLVNPNGITIGPGANIDVAGFMASTLNLSDADFLAGRMRFTQTPGAGSVVNHGTISTATGGMVYLVGHDVQNSGIIRSPQGEILLAAGKSVELVDAQTPEVRVQVTAPDNQAVNLGQLIAAGGRIGMYGTLVKHSGVASASTAVMGENGKIVFRATRDVTLEAGSVTTASGPSGGSVTAQAETGTLLASGIIEAKGDAGKGGTIQLLGTQVGLTGNASVDASGQTGGGTVLVGGDFQGKNPEIQNATATFLGANTSVRADALSSGDGGKVIVWSDAVSRAYGLISARGGAASGNGGFVETSSAGYLEVTRAPDLTAPAGKGGTWLLDPNNIVIGSPASGVFTDNDAGADANFLLNIIGVPSTITPAAIQAVLNNGANVIVDTSDTLLTGTDAGNITVAESITKSLGTDSTLTLKAHNDIIVNTGVSISSTLNKLNVVLNADQDQATSPGGSITMNSGSSILSNGGNILLGGGAGAAGNAIGTATNIVGVKLDNATLNAGAGNITIRGQGFTGASGAYGIQISGGADLITTATGAITLNGSGGSGAVAGSVGVGIEGSGTTVTAVDGAITITGIGNGTGSANDGVRLTTAAISTTGATGTGTITINGTGGAGTDNHGMLITSNSAGSSTISSVTGNITITGNGGVNTNSHGLVLEAYQSNNATVKSTGSANITLVGSTAGAGFGIQSRDGGTGTTNIIGDALMVGAITLRTSTTSGGDSISLANLNILSNNGNLFLEPGVASNAIGIAGGSGVFNLSTAELSTIQNGFASITIGRSDGQHAITVNAVTFNDPATIRTPTAGSITVNGQIAGAGNASVTLDGPGGAATTLNAGIVTAGNPIVISDNVILGTPATVTLDTTNGVPGGAGISIAGTINDDTVGTSGLVLQGGTGGAITLSGAMGGTTAPASLTATGNTINLQAVTTAGPGSGNISLQSVGAFTANSPLTAGGTGTVSIIANGVTNNSTITGPGGVTINADAGTFTNQSNATLQGIVTTGGVGNVTVIANNVDLKTGGVAGDSRINSGPLATIRAFTANTNYDTGTETAGRLSLTDAELDTITATTLRIGSTGNEGNINVSAALTPGGITGLSLLANGTSGSISGAGTVTVSDLRLVSVGAITLNGANSVTNFAAAGGANPVSFNNNGVLNIAIVDGQTGVTTTGGSASVTATGGNLNINQQVSSSGGQVDLTTATSGNVVLGANVTGGPVNIVSVGNITQSTGTVSGTDVVLDSATGVGTNATTRLAVTATNLAARSTASGGVFINESTGVTLQNIDPGTGAVTNSAFGNNAYDVTAAGTIVVGSGGVNTANTGDTNLTTTGGTTNNISLGANSVGNTTGNTVLISSGNITSGTGIVLGNNITLDSNQGVGTGVARVNTTAAILAARSVAAGGVFVNETNGITLADIGAVSNSITAGNTYDLQTANGSITVGGNVSAAGNGGVALTAGTTGAANDILAGAGRIATGSGLVTLSGRGIGVGSASPVLTDLGTGSIKYTTTGAGALGDVAFSNNTAGGFNTNQINATSSTTSGSAQTITIIQTAGNMTAGTFSAGTDNLSLLATNGSIVGSGTLTANDLRLDGFNGVGAAGTPILINAAQVAARLTNVTATGAIVIEEVTAGAGMTVGTANGLSGVATLNNRPVDLKANAGNLTINQAVNAGTGQVDLTIVTSGNVVLGANVTGGPVNVVSVGNITGAGTVSGTDVVLNSATGVGTGPGGRVTVTATNLAARSTASGGVFVSETNGVTLQNINPGTGVVTNAAAGAAYDVTVAGDLTVGTGGVNLATATSNTLLTTTGAATNDILLNANVGNTTGNTTLTSAGIISGAATVFANDLRLEAFNSIGDSGAPIFTNTAGNIAARLTNPAATGRIVIEEVAAGGDLTVGTANGLSGITTARPGGNEIKLAASSGNIVINQQVNGVSESIELTASSGTITDTAQLTGSTLTTTSAGGTVLDFGHAVTAFNATNTGSGNVHLVNTTPTLTVAGISQAGGGHVIIDNTGAIAVTGATVTGGNLSLTSTAGVSQTGAISAGLLTTSSVGGTILNAANTVSSFNGANITSGNIALTNAAAPLTVTGISQNGGGDVIINNTGGLTVNTLINNLGAGGAIDLMGTTGIGLGVGPSANNGPIFFRSPVTLTANVTVAAGSGGISFDDTLAGAFSLNANSTGTTTFANTVSGLTALITNLGGTTAINTTAVTTTGAQTYNDAVTVGANTTLTSSGGSNIRFVNTLNGAFDVTVNTAGATIFSGAVGGNAPLASLTTNLGGTTQVNGGSVITTGSQTYSDGITIAGPTTFNATAMTATLDFNATLAAATHALTLTADEINLAGGAGSVTGSGLVTLQPNNTAAAFNIGSAAGATVGALDLAVADLAALANGFSAINLGHAAGTHAITIGNATFQDTLLVRTPAGGSVNVSGALSSTENVAFNAGGAVQGGGSVTAPRVTIVAGGIGSLGTPLQLDTPDLDVQNSAGNAVMANAGPVNLLNNFRNTAAGGELRLIANNGAINTGAVAVQSAGGRIALIANDTTGGATGNVIVGTGGISSAGGDIALHAADNITINGAIAAGAGNVRMLAGPGPGINAAHASFTGGNPPAPTELATDEFGLIVFNAPASAANMVLVSSTSTTPTVINAITQTATGAISTTGALTAVTLRGGGAPSNGGGTIDLNDATGNNSTGLINLFACSFDGCPNPLPTAPFVNQGAPVPPFTTAVYSDGQLFYSDVGGTNVTGIGTSGDFTLYTPGSVTITGPSLSAKNLTIEALVNINVDLLAPFTNNDINGGQPGGSLNFIAGQNVNYTSMVAGATIGTAATPFNHDLRFQAAGNVTLANSIYIGAGNFVVQANQAVSLDGNTINIPTTGTGSVLMQGNHVVSSMGNLAVSGVNLTVQGGDTGSPNQSVGGQQLLSAGTIALNLTGDVNVAGGTATANSGSGALIRGAVVNAGSAGTPLANLNLTGGTSVVNGTTNHVADARITGTSTLNVRVAGNVGITGGSATITGTAGASQTAGASAVLEGGSFNFEVAGDVTLTGGVADAATGGNTATANAQIVAHSAFSPVIQGDLNLVGGSATAQPITGQIANAVARARFESDGNLQLNVGGNIDLQGGTAVAINNSGGAFAEADAGAFVHSDAKIGINVGQNFDITGGSATATGSSLRAIASAGVTTGDITAGESLLIATSGNMSLTGGTGAGAAADAAALIYSAAEAKLNISGAGGLRLEGGSGPFFPPYGSGVFTPNSDLFHMIGGNSLVRIAGSAYPITVTGLVTVVSNPALGAALFISEAPPLNLDSLLAAFIKTTDCVSFSGGSCTLSGATGSGSGKGSKDPAGGVCK